MKKIMSLIKITAALLIILVAVVSIRYLYAFQVVNSEQVTAYQIDVNDLGSTESLLILPLFEAWARTSDYQSGHGVAYLVETDQTRLLLDLGNNELRQELSPLAHNMQQHDLSIKDLDQIVISHNHPDHVGGINWWQKGTFSVDGSQNQLKSIKVYLPVELTYPDLDPVVVTEPVLIAPGIISLGRLPFIQPFPIWLWSPLGWEQSIAVNLHNVGLIVISGCGHPGLIQIVERAEQITGLEVKGIAGGLHYLDKTEQELAPDIEFLKSRNPSLVALSPHDSSGNVLQLFELAFPEVYRYILIGQEIVIPF